MKISPEGKTGFFTILGVIIGGLLTGIFSIVTTNQQQSIQEDLITSNNIQIESERFLNAVNKQISLFEEWDDVMSSFEYFVINDSTHKIAQLFQDNDMLEWTSELIANSYYIFLVSDYDFSKLTIALRDSLITATDSILVYNKTPFEKRLVRHDRVGLQFEAWLFNAKIEILKNNRHLTPDRIKEEEEKLLHDKLELFHK